MTKEMGTYENDTIAAIATAPGTGGIAVIRISGPEAIQIVSQIWRGADLQSSAPNKARFGEIIDPTTGQTVDEVLLTPFRSPASFTGEDTVEISVHGSIWIQREVLRLLVNAGVRIADRGEFTQRAFLNGKLDLAQAEAIADLIASSTRAAHRIALIQTRGGYSRRLEQLRSQLIEFASLLELELDFSEEDVEFADRQRLISLADETLSAISVLTDSYAAGKAIKEGIPVVIAGIPNAGKSTLLNTLLCDDKAIVTDIPGTTRDIIEDTIEIGGILFRLIDTAGLRETQDEVERIGIERTRDRMDRAAIIIRLLDATQPIGSQLTNLNEGGIGSPTDKGTKGQNKEGTPAVITVINKTDLSPADTIIYPDTGGDKIYPDINGENVISISAKNGDGLDELKTKLIQYAGTETEADMTVTNARHYESLTRAAEALRRARSALTANLSADFIAQDVREAQYHLGTITGAITTTDLLQTIFARFCIGK